MVSIFSSAPFVYDHCSCMETCENVKNNLKLVNSNTKSSCTAIKTEGCFCPNGTRLLNGKCVLERECTPCDDKNHYPGDTWFPDKCTECKCKNDTTISCSKKDCSLSQVICGLGFISVERSSPEECCKKFVCVPEPKVKTCPPLVLPKCSENQVNIAINGTDGCPKYICGKILFTK